VPRGEDDVPWIVAANKKAPGSGRPKQVYRTHACRSDASTPFPVEMRARWLDVAVVDLAEFRALFLNHPHQTGDLFLWVGRLPRLSDMPANRYGRDRVVSGDPLPGILEGIDKQISTLGSTKYRNRMKSLRKDPPVHGGNRGSNPRGDAQTKLTFCPAFLL